MNNSTGLLSLPSALVDVADVLILPVPYEKTVTYKTGTARGPEAILKASRQLEFYEEDAGWCPAEYMRIATLDPLSVKFSDEISFFDHLFDTVSALPGQNLLIALGGEHSITPEMVFARLPDGGTVVQVDAHADLRPSYHGSVYNHACPMFRLRERGYDLVQIGIRSLHAREAEDITGDEGITAFFDRTLQRMDGWQMLLQHLNSLTGPVWLTVDMDGFDPALVAGVGTPQPGGLSWHQGVEIVETLMNNQKIDIRGIDILELVPEHSRVSDLVAATLLKTCISFWGKARRFDQRPVQSSQTGVADE